MSVCREYALAGPGSGRRRLPGGPLAEARYFALQCNMVSGRGQACRSSTPGEIRLALVAILRAALWSSALGRCLPGVPVDAEASVATGFEDARILPGVRCQAIRDSLFTWSNANTKDIVLVSVSANQHSSTSRAIKRHASNPRTARRPDQPAFSCIGGGRHKTQHERLFTVHTVEALVGQRLLALLALGREDLVDHDRLRHDPAIGPFRSSPSSAASRYAST